MNRSLLILVVGTIVASTGCEQQPVTEVTLQERILPHRNPVNYEFDATISEVKAAIEEACGREWQRELAVKNRRVVWKENGSAQSRQHLSRALQEPMPRLFWKGEADSLTKHLLTYPGNENDAYVFTSDAPVESHVYFKDGQPLIYYADFHIHLTAMGQHKSRVEIFTYDPNVGTGIDERWSPHGPRLIRVGVDPTSVEEYQILLRIGEKLKTKDMPQLMIPNLDAPIRQIRKLRQN